VGKAFIFSSLLLVLLLVLPGSADAAVYIVTNTNDSGVGSLRDAINLANTATPGTADIINFSIPGSGPFTITPLSQLPTLTDPMGVIIDGFSQPGAAAGASPPSTLTLQIILDGSDTTLAKHGLVIKSANNTIQGLVIKNFQQDGIRIESGSADHTAINNLIYGNIIGLDVNGILSQGNGSNLAQLWAGVDILGTDPGIAQMNIVDANLISANYAEGVAIISRPGIADVAFNQVLHNYIGTDITGLVDLGNAHDGVYLGEGTHDNLVDGNLISGNDYDGVGIVGYWSEIEQWSTATNTVSNNLIGLDISLGMLGNTHDGVSIGQYGTQYAGGYAPNNHVLTNVIAYNGVNGVTVWEHPSSATNADGNVIGGNDIYTNGGLGIDLDDDGVTVNDLTDPDSGANQDVNFPMIYIADYCAGTTTVAGAIDIDTDPTKAVVEVFLALPDPSGYGEGALFLGQAVPAADSSWLFTCFRQLIPGDLVTATCNDLNGNTSEFAQYITVVLVSTCGDVNGDGTTDAQDALDLANYLAGAAITFAGNADLNQDTVIDAVDLALLMQVLAGNL